MCYSDTTPTDYVLHLFDAIVIILTITLEVILKGKERELAGLLVVLRLWRIVKLVSQTSNTSLAF